MDVRYVVATFLGMALLGLIAPRIRRRSTVSRPYPPGPSPLPIIGNVHQLPATCQELKLFKWSHIYGDIMRIQLFNAPVIVVSSIAAARELMDKRSANYSDRPPFTLLKLVGWDGALSLLSYNDPRFKLHRKWVSNGLQSSEARAGHYIIQRREACTLMLGLVENPDAFEDHIKRFSAAAIVDIAYGHKVTALDDEFIVTVDKAMTGSVRLGSPSSDILGSLVDFFPWLQYYPSWLPGSRFRQRIEKVRGYVLQTLDMPYQKVKEKVISGEATASFAASLIEERLTTDSLTYDYEKNIKDITGTLYGAGVETTTGILKALVLAMVLHPEVLKKAQDEVDRVIGNERLPDIGDKDSLPYLSCIIREVFRWCVPLPLCVPHCSSYDDIFRGFAIAAGTIILPNVWAMFRDPDTYPDPERFWPERFEGLTKADIDAIDPTDAAFGFGRRKCPGQQLAETSVFLVASYLVATMNITKARDDNGVEITPTATFSPGLTRNPDPFTCAIQPRSQKAVALIKQTQAFF